MLGNGVQISVVEALLDIVKSANEIGRYHRYARQGVPLGGTGLESSIIKCLEYIADGEEQWATEKIDEMKKILGEYLKELDDA